MKNVIVSVRTVINAGSPDEMCIEYETRGECFSAAGSKDIWYDEPEYLEMGRVRTRVGISGREAVICREGDVRSEMRFVPGERFAFSYLVADGTLTLFTLTEKLHCRGENGEYTINIVYGIYNDDEKLSDNEILLKIKEV